MKAGFFGSARLQRAHSGFDRAGGFGMITPEQERPRSRPAGRRDDGYTKLLKAWQAATPTERHAFLQHQAER